MAIDVNSIADTTFFVSPLAGLSDPSLQFLVTPGTAPIIGGETDVTLLSPETLVAAGISATPLGSSTIDLTGALPVVRSAVTGGTEGPATGSAMVLHQGSGFEFSNAAHAVELQNFTLDTELQTISAVVTVDDLKVGRAAIFDIAPDGTASFTETGAALMDQTFGTTAFVAGTPAATVDMHLVALQPLAPVSQPLASAAS